MLYLIKIFITVVVVIASSEIAKRFPMLGALIVSLPVTSLVAMSFLYYDTKDVVKVAEFSREIPPVVISSIIFFYAFSFFVDGGFSFVIAMLLAVLLMLSVYALYIFFSTRVGL